MLIECLTAPRFEEIDFLVMGHAYASQNELGRLCDESAYRGDLQARLAADGVQAVAIQTPLTVTHRGFSKRYFLDLIVENAVYELKADDTLASEHQTQLLNYMFLLGIQRAKLLNFGGPKVEGKLIATSLTQADRRKFAIGAKRWRDLTAQCAFLRETFAELLADWGAFLEINLYQAALVHFLGGEQQVEKRVELRRQGLRLGAQRMLVHGPNVAFRISAIREDTSYFESHLRRLLALTNLDAIQWINLNYAQIDLITIAKGAGE